MARVLVTGGAGFVGSVVARHLLEGGHRVRIADNLMYGGSPLLGLWNRPDVDFLIGDLCDVETRARALAGMEAIVHLAAIVGDPACKRKPEVAWRTNFEMTRELVDDARRLGVSRFLFVSTCSNYGVSNPDSFVDEDSALNPVSLYAESKVKSEELILKAAGDGFDPTVFRLATCYGVSPRMRFDLLINDFTREAFARRKIVIYGEQFWRPHIHVLDVARAMRLAIETPTDPSLPRVFNVGDQSENYQKETIARIAVEHVPGTELEFVKRDEDPRSYRVRFDRIQQAYGFRISRTVRDGTAEVLRVLREGLVTDYDDPKYVN